jgi:dolichol-phosphate mannosyltransferase
METIRKEDSRFKTIHFSRNFGHQVAITAGMDFASGQAVVVMDADLQDPPEVVLEMVDKWKEGFHVVYAVRRKRSGETWFKRVTAAAFYRMLNHMTEIEIPADVGDFRLIDRAALEESARYVRGMFSWVGFKQVGITYDRPERFAGETKYPLRKMLRFAMDGVLGFSNFPLRLVMSFGAWVAIAALLAGTWAITAHLTGRYTVSGWTSVIVLISFIGGVQLLVLGIIGQYIGRIHEESKARPLYFVQRVEGFAAELEVPLRAVWIRRPHG